jgi:hypothetical protein
VYLAKWARIVAEEGERARKAEYGVDDSSLLEDEMGETGVFEVLAVSSFPLCHTFTLISLT